MAAVATKRKAARLLEGLGKDLRDERSLQSPDPSLRFEDDYEDEDSYRDDKEESSEDEDDQTADTPITPFSPRKKFPSELKTIRCTFEGCTKTFNRPARLASHIRSHNNERPFICTYDSCDKSYIDEKHLRQHIKGSHTHERSYHCNWEGCSISFLTATRLRRHIEAHEGHDRFRCTAYPPCNQSFRKHHTLQRHIRADHLELAPYPCTYIDPINSQLCNAGFDGAAGLRKHEERMHSLPRFFCPDCTLPAFNPDGTSIHLGFTTAAQLKTHIRKEHANCAFCDRKCSSQRELQKHVESQHAGTTLEQRKNIPCKYDNCNKTFTKKYNLSVHIRTQHCGQRYICGTFDISKTPDLASWDNKLACGNDFVSKANLEDHIRTVHLGLPSAINARRKKPAPNSDDEGDDFAMEPKKRRSKKPKQSAIDELLGNSYAADKRRNIPCIISTCPHLFIRQYDLQQHVRSRHRLSTPEIDEIVRGAVAELEHEFEFSPGDARNDEVYGDEGDGEEEEDKREELDAMYDQADIDWEIQRRPLEIDPFWIGGDDVAVRNNDQWMQDELEMRRLISGEGIEGFFDGDWMEYER